VTSKSPTVRNGTKQGIPAKVAVFALLLRRSHGCKHGHVAPRGSSLEAVHNGLPSLLVQ
jgi:hypothetical protein